MNHGEGREPCPVAALPPQGIAEGAMAQPADAFFDDLCKALRTRGNPVSQRERSIALSLQPVLWEAAELIRAFPLRGYELTIEASNAARAEAERADEIAQLATKLLKRLPKEWRVGDVLAGWSSSILEAQPVLARIVQDANVTAAGARRRAKRQAGRRPNWNREDLSEWVALNLFEAGVRPTTTKTGPFARVLAVVQRAAGLGDRNVERDVRNALKNEWVVRHLAK